MARIFLFSCERYLHGFIRVATEINLCEWDGTATSDDREASLSRQSVRRNEDRAAPRIGDHGAQDHYVAA